MDGWTLTERYGSSELRKAAELTRSRQLKIRKLKVDKRRWLYLVQLFKSVFLPQGYPESVSDDYIRYQVWDTIQAFSSSITSSLATQAVLRGVGVGDEGATVMAATITWLLKDGAGMLGRILFAWFKGTSLDCHCKRWRLFADILNDAAICLELLSPIFKANFRLIVCLVGICRAIVGVAGGATRTALTQHQARRNNLADVAAKDGSQETLVNLSALICNLILIPYVTGNESLIWFLFVLFTCLHLYANYRAVTSVCMEIFNQDRFHIAAQHFLQTNNVLSVQLTNLKEPVVYPLKRILAVKVGTSLLSCTQSGEEISSLLSLFAQHNEKYLLKLDAARRTVTIVLHENYDVADLLRACFQAEILEYNFAVSSHLLNTTDNSMHLVSLSHSQTLKLLPLFLAQAEELGWVLSRVLFGADEWRCNWTALGWGDDSLVKS